MNDLRAASVQFQHVPGDKARNLATVREWTAKAAAAGAELVVFPEMCLTGYWHLRDLPRAELEALAEPVRSWGWVRGFRPGCVCVRTRVHAQVPQRCKALKHRQA